MLSETAKAAIWAELPRLTLALKPAAARVLTWLTTEALARGGLSARASCRAIAEGTGLNKSSSIRGTTELVALRLIAKREGTATRSAAYLLRFAETLKMGGRLKRPPVESFPQNESDQPGRLKRPPDFAESQQTGQLFETAPGVLSIDSKTYKAIGTDIDRSGEFPTDEKEKAECKALLELFVRHKMRWTNAHPPDKKILAVFLRVAEWPMLKAWLESMIKSREDTPPNIGSPYAWLVTVAINRIHGIPAEEQKPTLELLRGGRQMYTRFHTEGLK